MDICLYKSIYAYFRDLQTQLATLKSQSTEVRLLDNITSIYVVILIYRLKVIQSMKCMPI